MEALERASQKAAGLRLWGARQGFYSSAAEASRACGVSPRVLAAHEAGLRPISAAQAERYGRAFIVPPGWLLFGEVEALALRVPVLGRAEAGVWREGPILERAAATAWLPVSVDRYETAHLFALETAGPGCDSLYQPGAFVIVAPRNVSGLREGDHVVTIRGKAGLSELTVSVFELGEAGYVISERSSDPRYQRSHLISVDGDAKDEPFIYGVVVAQYSVWDRGEGEPSRWVMQPYKSL